MKATEICKVYPAAYKIEFEDNELELPIYSFECTISISPFANCQTFSIGQSSMISSIKDMDSFMKLLMSTTGKYQFVIDLVNERIASVLNKLNPYISWKKQISYINRTETPMTLFLIRLDEDKILELFRNKPL